MERRQPQSDVHRAVAGEPDAIQRLWVANRRWVAALLLAHKPADAEVDDLLQEAALNFVRTIQDLREPAKLKPWLRTLAVNTARTAARRNRLRLRPAPLNDGHVEQIEDPASQRNEARGQGRDLLALAGRLQPDYREPLLLSAVHGMTRRQIAEVLALPITTVETRLARARRMLREEADFEQDAASLNVTRRVEPRRQTPR